MRFINFGINSKEAKDFFYVEIPPVRTSNWCLTKKIILAAEIKLRKSVNVDSL